MDSFIVLVKKDIIAYDDSISFEKVKFIHFIYRYIKTPGFRVSFHMRLCNLLSKKYILRFIYLAERLYYRRLQVKFGVQIGYNLNIGGGFSINHYGGIVIGSEAVIGENFSIRNNITIGHSRGESPIIGNNVTVGAGAIIIGKVNIGNNVMIGAGAVVTKSVPDNSVVVGNPAKVIKMDVKMNKDI